MLQGPAGPVPCPPWRWAPGGTAEARGPSPCRGVGHVSGKHPGVEPCSEQPGSRAQPGTCGGHAAATCPSALDDGEDRSRTQSSAEKHQPAASPQPSPAPPGAAGALPKHQSTSAPCFSSETLSGHHQDSPRLAAGWCWPFAPWQYLRVSTTDRAPRCHPREGQGGCCLPRVRARRWAVMGPGPASGSS